MDTRRFSFSGDVSPSQFINPMIMNNEPTNNALHEVETEQAQAN